VLRRLLTNPGSYIWHLEYRAGLPQYLGQPAVLSAINSLIISQMFLEDTRP
jgi:hypothetical protein